MLFRSQLTGVPRGWAAELAEKILAAPDDAGAWQPLPVEGMKESASPWFTQRRVSADGNKDARFWGSLPPGGERLTGALRSPAFTVPAKLTFFLAGHDGYPDKPAQKRNVVRLLAADSRAVLAEKFPSRNDTAQPVTWDLSAHAGKRAFLEVTDADNGDAYAWLAVGRFDPPVVAVPEKDSTQIARRRQAAAELARTLPLPELLPQLVALLASAAPDLDTRAAVARALLAIRPNEQLTALAPLLADSTVPVRLREQIGVALASQDVAATQAVLVEALRASPHRVQLKLAQSLAGSANGAESLLALVSQGQAPASLLQASSVKDKLLAAKPDSAARVAELTKGLAPVSEKLQKLIEQRRAGYAPAKASPVEGAALFTKNCAVCHQIDGRGGIVGPQLDGLGTRGLERLCEDILDPNRSVDRAFRSTLLTLKDGDIVSGLFRREEGEMLVLAEATGKEISVQKKQVTERRESDTSLMPENFGELLTTEEFNHLMAFLLSKGSKAP